MPTNRINAALPQADIDAVMAAVTTVKQKLPFITELTTDERKLMPKLGNKSCTFVEKTLELATQNKNILPRDFDIEELRKEVTLFKSMTAIQEAIAKLSEQINDTVTAAGSDAYIAALQVYNLARNSGISTSGLENSMDELGRRFAHWAKTPVNPKN